MELVAIIILALGFLLVFGVLTVCIRAGVKTGRELWLYYRYRRWEDVHLKDIITVAYLPEKVRSGMVPLGLIPIWSATGGMVMFIVALAISASGGPEIGWLGGLGFFLFFVPLAGFGLVVMGKSMFTGADMSAKGKRAKDRAFVESMVEKLSTPAPEPSLDDTMGFLHYYWRVAYTADLLLHQSQAAEDLDQDVIGSTLTDLERLRSDPRGDRRLRQEVRSKRRQLTRLTA